MKNLINRIKNFFTDDTQYGVFWSKKDSNLLAEYYWNKFFDNNKCDKCGK